MINDILKYFMGTNPVLSIIFGIFTLFLVSTNWLDNGLMSYLILQIKPFFLEVKLELMNLISDITGSLHEQINSLKQEVLNLKLELRDQLGSMFGYEHIKMVLFCLVGLICFVAFLFVGAKYGGSLVHTQTILNSVNQNIVDVTKTSFEVKANTISLIEGINTLQKNDVVLSGVVKDLADVSSKFYMNNSILTTPTITDVSGSGLAVEAAQRAALNTPGDGIAQTAAFVKSLTK
jgi:hypothetical protein